MRDDEIMVLVRRGVDESPRLARIEDDVSTLKGDVSALKGDVSALKGDVSALKGDVSALKGDVSALKGDVSTLKGDVSALKGDVSTLKGDVSTLKGDVATMKGSISSLEMESRRQGILMEVVQGDLKAVLDVVTSMDQRLDGAQSFRETVDRHSDRLDAVEATLKGHIKDRLAHRSVGPVRGKRQ